MADFCSADYTFEEQHVWALIEENGYFWLGKWEKGRWRYSTTLGSIVRDRVDEHWDDLLAVALGEKPSDDLPKVTEKTGKPEPKPEINDEIPF